MESVDEEEAQADREAAFAWFKTLSWVPYPLSDRIWSTKQPSGKAWFMVPQTKVLHVIPSIAINGELYSVTEIANLGKN